jgi:NADPH-dependent glutamate synthase beta subunit-like oxidoreductase
VQAVVVKQVQDSHPQTCLMLCQPGFVLIRAFNNAKVVPLLMVALQNSHGVHAAREFVWWYNGHPDQRDLPVDLSRVEAVAVCGIGNVALDCARILLRPVSELASTDIARHALQQLQHSKVRQVQLCARRGPVQVRL